MFYNLGSITASRAMFFFFGLEINHQQPLTIQGLVVDRHEKRCPNGNPFPVKKWPQAGASIYINIILYIIYMLSGQLERYDTIDLKKNCWPFWVLHLPGEIFGHVTLCRGMPDQHASEFHVCSIDINNIELERNAISDAAWVLWDSLRRFPASSEVVDHSQVLGRYKPGCKFQSHSGKTNSWLHKFSWRH